MADAYQDPKPPILQLPYDIYARIFSYLISPSDTFAIHAVLKTCKHLYNVALPASVHTFRGGGTPSRRVVAKRAYSRNLLFLRYILITKPDLAAYVRTLVLTPSLSAPSGSGCLQQDVPSESEILVYRELWERYANPSSSKKPSADRDDWTYSYRDRIELYLDPNRNRVESAGSTERGLDKMTISISGKHKTNAEAALILLACPKLQSLYIEASIRPLLDLLVDLPQVFDDVADEGSARPEFPLHNLKEFHHESQDMKYGYTGFSSVAATMFQVPGLRRYECLMANGSEDAAKPFISIPPRSSTVEEIYLRKSTITSALLVSMAGSCKALKTFEYTRGVYHMYDMELMPRELLEGLLPHADTLEYLYVNFEDDWDKMWSESEEKICMGIELAKMTQLKTLIMGMQALTGLLDCQPTEIFGQELPLEIEGAPRLIQSLPDNLVHLEIHGCGKAILPQAQELLDAIGAGTRLTQLERVRFLFNAENINATDVHLACDKKPSLQIDIVFQTQRNRLYDLIPSYHLWKQEQDREHGEPRGQNSLRPQSQRLSQFLNCNGCICSPIFAGQLREQWLELRGKNIGSATVNEGLYRAPGLSRTSPPHITD